MPVSVEMAKEKWAGQVRVVTLGATAADGGTREKTVSVGGESAMHFLSFDTPAGAAGMPHPPALALEIRDRRPDDWSPLLNEAWGEAMDDPGDWAHAAEAAGADLIVLTLSLTTADGQPNTPARARAVVRQVLTATGLPLAVFGPGQAETDNELIVPVA